MDSNEKIINEKDAQLAFAMNREDVIAIQPNKFATPEKCVEHEGLCSTVATWEPGKVGEKYSRGK